MRACVVKRVRPILYGAPCKHLLGQVCKQFQNQVYQNSRSPMFVYMFTSTNIKQDIR